MSYIIFNNKNSLDIKGLYINSLPTLDSPERRVNKQQVVGRSGDLRVIENDEYGNDVYNSIEKQVQLTYLGTNYDLIKKWLRGTSNLTLSNQPDRYWKASIDNTIPVEYIIEAVNTFTITFSCYPYAFLKTGDTPIIYNPTQNTWETIIMNEYDLSLPHLKIYGQGDIGIMVNGIETDFYSVDDYIEVDSDLQQCYKGTQNMGMNMSGKFPALYPGKNIIEFTGNISKVAIIPRWQTR